MLKEGAAEDMANRERIAKLLRFASTHDGTEAQTVSLADYVGRMKEGQEAIYYITADSFAAARNSPHLEIFRKRGVEVLLMYDRIDEWVVSSLTEFEGKPLHSVAKGDLDLSKLGGDAAKEEAAKPGEDETAAARPDAGGTEGSRQRRAHDRAADRIAGLSRQRRVRHEHESRADPQGRRPEGPRHRSRCSRSTRATRSSSGSKPRPTRRASPTGATSCSTRRLLAEGGQLEDPASFVKRLNELMLTLAGEGPSRIWTPGS